MAHQRVIVVGGGVIGAACAYYLARSGCQVRVVDQGQFGRGCSHGNCGYVSPSHVLPLAEPGAVATAVRALLTPNSPFKIRLRFDPRLWSWLIRFARRCNHRDMLAAARGCHALLDSSRRLYDQIFQDEPIDCEWQTEGMLFVFRTPKKMEEYAETDALLREHFQLGAQRIGADELCDFEPALKPGLAGAWFYQNDAHLRPDRLMAGWRQVLQRLGVDIIENLHVDGFVTSDGAAVAVRTRSGEWAADAFVVATGAWTPLLERQLGSTIPIQPGKGYSITMARPARCPRRPVLFPEHRVGVTPMKSAYRLGSTMEFAGYDPSLRRRRLELLRRGAEPYLVEPWADPVEEEWFGWRPMTYDGMPIIDRSPAMGNVFIAAGHNMLGLSMSPATGKLVAELLTGQPPHIDPLPYSVRRFD